MIYLLDTSACVEYLRLPDSGLRRWLSVDGVMESVRLCSVVRAELLLGVRKLPTERNRLKVYDFIGLFESFPFDDVAAEFYADIRADLEARGKVIGPYDMQISAVALTHGATLVTGNEEEFYRVKNLKCLTLAEVAAGKTIP